MLLEKDLRPVNAIYFSLPDISELEVAGSSNEVFIEVVPGNRIEK